MKMVKVLYGINKLIIYVMSLAMNWKSLVFVAGRASGAAARAAEACLQLLAWQPASAWRQRMDTAIYTGPFMQFPPHI